MRPYCVTIEQIQQGMITVDDVMSPSGQLVIPKQTMLNPRLISRLKLYNIKKLYVMIPDNVAEELNRITPLTAVNPIKVSQEFKVFRHSYEDMAKSLEEAFSKVMEYPDRKHDFSDIIGAVLALAGSVKNTMHLMDTLQCLREYSDTVYIHSISVALIAHMIAAKKNYDTEEIRTLTLAGLFHDIGKLHIPVEILNKPSKLTAVEYEVVKKHPQLSYEILKKAHFPSEVLLVALLHHERCDGSGYPTAATADKITEFARIIAIADVYDAMTARRAYRSEICSFDVIEDFEQSGYQKYDTSFLLPFLESIAQSHINVKVRLSNSLVGTIVMINQHKLSRPVVNVDGTFLDLSREKDLSIIGLL
ncbi:MAG: HD-GYP domain-containing protein [Lachnospiraceae bacterium]|nr:HD-GYP domain-containing protein [Lachnospiraceae bacterium]